MTDEVVDFLDHTLGERHLPPIEANRTGNRDIDQTR